MVQVGLTILMPKSISLPISAMAWYIFENTIKQRANTVRDQYPLPWPICKYVLLISPYIGMLWKVFKVNKAKSLQVLMNNSDKCYQRKLERNIYLLNFYHLFLYWFYWLSHTNYSYINILVFWCFSIITVKHFNERWLYFRVSLRGQKAAKIKFRQYFFI